MKSPPSSSEVPVTTTGTSERLGRSKRPNLLQSNSPKTGVECQGPRRAARTTPALPHRGPCRKATNAASGAAGRLDLVQQDIEPGTPCPGVRPEPRDRRDDDPAPDAPCDRTNYPTRAAPCRISGAGDGRQVAALGRRARAVVAVVRRGNGPFFFASGVATGMTIFSPFAQGMFFLLALALFMCSMLLGSPHKTGGPIL